MSVGPAAPPWPAFRFGLRCYAAGGTSTGVSLCEGWFSECSGLEATMEPFQIREGGRNHGVIQRPGPVSHAPLLLKRGMTANRELWEWFDAVVNQQHYAKRLDVVVLQRGYAAGEADPVLLAWRLHDALPVRFKAADLNALDGAVAIEELQLVHQGMERSTEAEG